MLKKIMKFSIQSEISLFMLFYEADLMEWNVI